MSCERSREIDLDAFLVEPRAPEWASFVAHYPLCRDCSRELARAAALEEVLREVTHPPHPSDEDLLAFRRRPDALGPARRAEIAAHLEECAPCRDALGAVVALDLPRLLRRPQTTASPAAAVGTAGWLGRLRGWLELPGLPAWAAVAAALLLVLGLGWWLRGGAGPAPEAPPLAQAPAPERASPVPPAPAPGRAAPRPEESLAGSAAPEPAAPAAPRTAEAPPAPPGPPPSHLAQTPPPAPAPPEAPAPSPRPPEDLITSLGVDPVVFATARGLPEGRLGAAVRSATAPGPAPVALVPRELGLTLEAQPTFYWELPARSTAPLVLTLNDPDAMKTLLRVVVPAPVAAGVHALRLRDRGVTLQTGRFYEWMVAVGETGQTFSGGVVKRIAPDAELRRALARADPAQRVRLLAAHGIWYDAFDLLSRSLDRRPQDAALRRARADLLAQVGLGGQAAR